MSRLISLIRPLVILAIALLVAVFMVKSRPQLEARSVTIPPPMHKRNICPSRCTVWTPLIGRYAYVSYIGSKNYDLNKNFKIRYKVIDF